MAYNTPPAFSVEIRPRWDYKRTDVAYPGHPNTKITLKSEQNGLKLTGVISIDYEAEIVEIRV